MSGEISKMSAIQAAVALGIAKRDITELTMDDLTDARVSGSVPCLVSPEIAAEILAERNPSNRRIGTSAREYLVQVITSGQWRPDHPAPIVFDDKGNLIDGQHRLSAIAESRCWVVAPVAFQKDRSVREHMDCGKPRTMNERVAFVSDATANIHASRIVNQWWLTERDHRRGKLSPKKASEIFKEHGKAIAAISGEAARSKGKDCPPWRITAVQVALCKMAECDMAKALRFIRQIELPDPDTKVARLFREFLFRHKHSGTWAGCLETYEYSLCACGAALSGKQITRIERSSVL